MTMTKIQDKALQNQQAAQLPAQETAPAKQTVTTLLNAMLDSEGYRRRFNELLGKRTPQFVSSIVSMVNADVNLQKAFAQAPITVIQSALKAASYDLPIDPGLGYTYIMPFNNSYKLPDDSWGKRMEATCILGYKGMIQLALRTGAYKTINALEVREGELISYNRLTEDIVLNLVEDEDEREKLPIIGYVGFYRLINGTEKTVYMSKKQIAAHEIKHRKGKVMSKGWRDDFNAMALKTVIRVLIGKWGLMSIEYQQATPAMVKAAEALAQGVLEDEDSTIPVLEGEGMVSEATDGEEQQLVV